MLFGGTSVDIYQAYGTDSSSSANSTAQLRIASLTDSFKSTQLNISAEA